VVILLLLPLRNAGKEEIDFSRVMLGIMLFVIFSGKMFYDALLDSYKRKVEGSMGREVIAMLGMVIVMALVIGLVVASVGLLVYLYLQPPAPQ
jgi:hypothetical protein